MTMTHALTHQPHYLLVGLDAKVDWQHGQMRCLPPGGDQLLILDIDGDPLAPRTVGCVPLPNSVFGPPTNLAVTPDQRTALVADSMAWLADGAGWQPAPGSDLYVIDLPSGHVRQRLTVGLQPSGLAINRAGTLALVANRAGRSVSVLDLRGDTVRHAGDVALGTPAAAVAFSADGQRAYVAKMDTHRLGVLHIDGTQVRHDAGEDIVTGLVPFNVCVSPNGHWGLTVDMGHPNASDGHTDTVSVVDLRCEPPRAVARLTVGDGPEGLAISPDGRHAAVAIVQGCNVPADSWFHHPRGAVVLLAIDTTGVRVADRIEVGVLPEGLAFSPDGTALYVGNYLDKTLQILQVQDGRLHPTHHAIALGGHPASLRAQSF